MSTKRIINHKRHRVPLLSLLCAAGCCISEAFLSTSIDPVVVKFHNLSHSVRLSPVPRVLHAVSSKSISNPLQSTRLTHEEQKQLLLQSVELRRIQKIQSEMKLARKMVTPLQLARATGYGDELLDFEDAVMVGESARERLVTTNMGLVHYCVRDILKKRPKLKSITRDDLVQEGAIGLTRAVDRWNIVIGGKFSTYAVYWVRAAILRCIAEKDDLVRVPVHVTDSIVKVTRAAAGLNVELDSAWREAAHAKALAEKAGISDQQLVEAMKVRERRNVGILSFESWMQHGKDFEKEIFLSPTEDKSKQSSSSICMEHFENTLARFLRPREMEALSLRYGLDRNSSKRLSSSRNYLRDAEAELFHDNIMLAPKGGRWGEAMSFVEVGLHMHISAEYGRRLCHAALDKLRRAAAEGAIEATMLAE